MSRRVSFAIDIGGPIHWAEEFKSKLLMDFLLSFCDVETRANIRCVCRLFRQQTTASCAVEYCPLELEPELERKFWRRAVCPIIEYVTHIFLNLFELAPNLRIISCMRSEILEIHGRHDSVSTLDMFDTRVQISAIMPRLTTFTGIANVGAWMNTLTTLNLKIDRNTIFDVEMPHLYRFNLQGAFQVELPTAPRLKLLTLCGVTNTRRVQYDSLVSLIVISSAVVLSTTPCIIAPNLRFISECTNRRSLVCSMLRSMVNSLVYKVFCGTRQEFEDIEFQNLNRNFSAILGRVTGRSVRVGELRYSFDGNRTIKVECVEGDYSGQFIENTAIFRTS